MRHRRDRGLLVHRSFNPHARVSCNLNQKQFMPTLSSFNPHARVSCFRDGGKVDLPFNPHARVRCNTERCWSMNTPLFQPVRARELR